MIKKRGFRLIVRIISIEGENPAFKDKKISGYLLLATGNGGWEEGSHVSDKNKKQKYQW